jgi:DNA-binding FadR family transcriptional regulator
MSNFNLLEYLSSARHTGDNGAPQIPSLKELGEEYHVSIAKLREQLSVARSLGFVDVQPRTGITLLPYSFSPAVKNSLAYALSVDRSYFKDFSDLRRHVEANYWYEAVEKLDMEDLSQLNSLVENACIKLNSSPPQLPHQEHRDLHLIIYGKLDNVFVVGLLEAYWDAYEAVGLTQYTELSHLKSVWQYHAQIVEALVAGDVDRGYQLLLEHMDLIKDIPSS